VNSSLSMQEGWLETGAEYNGTSVEYAHMYSVLLIAFTALNVFARRY
jgi:hypothetical protein